MQKCDNVGWQEIAWKEAARSIGAAKLDENVVDVTEGRCCIYVQLKVSHSELVSDRTPQNGHCAFNDCLEQCYSNALHNVLCLILNVCK